VTYTYKNNPKRKKKKERKEKRNGVSGKSLLVFISSANAGGDWT